MQRLLQWANAKDGHARLVTYLNAHNVNLACEDEEYLKVLQGADLLYADGMGVVWAWRRLGQALPERVNAGDLIEEFCQRAAERNLSIYLLGSFPEVAEGAAQAWQAKAPGLRIAGCRNGFFSEEEEEAIAREIALANPDILLVGMGVPRQEQWAAKWKDATGASVVWCVGALFEYWGMRRSRAPIWMRRIGLEWLWRLALEPRRMAKRYLWGNLVFVWNVMRMRG